MSMETTKVRQLVPIPEACQRLGGIGSTTIYELVSRGELVKVNIGRRGFITAASLDAYVDRLTAAGADEGRSADLGEARQANSDNDDGSA